MNPKIYLMALAVTLSACGAKSQAESAVREQLKDPESAKFGEFTLVKGELACLTVNAKNSMGGYTGDQQASLVKTPNGWAVMDISERSHQACISILEALPPPPARE